MPLIAHNELPAFQQLHEEGQIVLSSERAEQQDIRTLHVGLLNMMPDAALIPTERQFFRLIGASNPIAQFRVHPFALPHQERGAQAQQHIDTYYETFDQIRAEGLDALIITGANVTHDNLSEEPFWEPLLEITNWAHENVTSTLCSCLATHAVLEARHGERRQHLGYKRWGVYPHRVTDKKHPLVSDINTRFNVPHSRYNVIDRERFESAGLRVLVEGEVGGVHLAVSGDGIRTVYFQRPDYPPFPDNYFNLTSEAIFEEYKDRLQAALDNGQPLPVFPEQLIIPNLDNTWHDSGLAVIGNWMGLVYQITNTERRLPFMSGINPENPLNLTK